MSALVERAIGVVEDFRGDDHGAFRPLELTRVVAVFGRVGGCQANVAVGLFVFGLYRIQGFFFFFWWEGYDGRLYYTTV